MLKDSIMACKLYRSSNHKESILQALDDNLNVELVQQLSSSLDKDSLPGNMQLKDKDAADHSDAHADVEPNASGSEPAANSAPNTSSRPSVNVSVNTPPATFNGPEGVEPESSEESSADQEGTNQSSAEESPANEPSANKQSADNSAPEPKELEPEKVPLNIKAPEAPKSQEDVDQSTYVDSSQSIDSATVLYNNDVSGTQVPELNTEVLKGDLNSTDDTHGVSRIQIRDQELWIYYNDTVNLNDIMEAVIEKLIARTYSYLEFNRLARKNNAIVFDILDHSPRAVTQQTNE